MAVIQYETKEVARRVQYRIVNVDVSAFKKERGAMVLDLTNLEKQGDRVRYVLMTGSRLFRQNCLNMHERQVLLKDRFNQVVVDENEQPVYVTERINDATEFAILNFRNRKVDTIDKDHLLRNGFFVKYIDPVTKKVKKVRFRRVGRSPSQVRTQKVVYTSLNPRKVRELAMFGMDIPEEEIIAKLESRFGLAMSSTIAIPNISFTFDILPDYEIKRKFKVETAEVIDKRFERLVRRTQELKLNPLDGQGTVSPRLAVMWAKELGLISKSARDYMLSVLADSDNVPQLVKDHQLFAKQWERIPSAFQVRIGLSKGLLVVRGTSQEVCDCNGMSYRTTENKNDANVMKFWKKWKKVEKYKGADGKTHYRHNYDFNADILFTDSMWKANIDPKYIESGEMHAEIVLWQKSKASGKTYMGYQYWQALKDVEIRQFADEAINEIKDTILTDAKDALVFLGMIDNATESDDDEYVAQMAKSGTKIQRLIEVLNENPDMVREPMIQAELKALREEFIEKMATGRIPVDGANPYIISDPSVMFGHVPVLGEGEYYYNNRVFRAGIFRSPLIHRSEAVVIDTVQVDEWVGLYRDLLVMNVFDDTLPRMGGADTDGDKVAMVYDPRIIAGIQTDLPMLFDSGDGGTVEKVPVDDMAIYRFDFDTICKNDVKSIGEITNMATTWKELLETPEELKKLGRTVKQVEAIIKILRFMQGWSIDFAKKGYMPTYPAYVLTKWSPDWKPWSENMMSESARVFDSQSQIGHLFRGINKYMEVYRTEMKNKKVGSRDFTYELTAACDLEAKDRIYATVQALEKLYRDELTELGNRNLDDDQHKEEIAYVFEKHRNALMSLPADVATIGAVAYEVTKMNGSNSGSMSYPWVCAYEGILANLSVSGKDRFKLKRAKVDGHLDDIPDKLTFIDGLSVHENFTVESKVADGTYEVFKKAGFVSIVVPVESIADRKVAQMKRPAERSIPFTSIGYRENGVSAEEFIEALKAADGIMEIIVHKEADDIGEYRYMIFVGGKRMASVRRADKPIVTAYLPAVVKVNNVDKLEPLQYFKRPNERLNRPAGWHEALTHLLDATFVQGIRDERVQELEIGLLPDIDESAVDNKYYEIPSDYMNYPTDHYFDVDYSNYKDEPVAIDEEQEIDVPRSRFKAALLDRISTEASYWAEEVAPEDLNVVLIKVKQTGAIKTGVTCAEVTLVRRTNNGGTKEAKVNVRYAGNKTFAIVEETFNRPEYRKWHDLVLQTAHYELFRQFLEAQEQKLA